MTFKAHKAKKKKNGNMQFQKKSIPTPRKVFRNSQGEGILKVKILETKCEAKLEFPGETGVAKQKTRGGSTDIFWNCTMEILCKWNSSTCTSDGHPVEPERLQH